MSVTKSVALLEERIAHLEKQIYGFGKTVAIDDPVPSNTVIDRLQGVNSLISSALSGREKSSAVIKRLPELNGYLDPASEDIDISTSAKAQLLLTIKPEIIENHKLLTNMQKLLPALELQHIKDVPELSTKLNKLSFSFLETYDIFEKLNAQIHDTLFKYDKVINSTSESLIALDAAVKAAEAAAKPKKRTDD